MVGIRRFDVFLKRDGFTYLFFFLNRYFRVDAATTAGARNELTVLANKYYGKQRNQTYANFEFRKECFKS